MQTESITLSLFERFAEVPLILCKDKYKNDNQQVFMQKSFILNEHFFWNRSFSMNTFFEIVHSQWTLFLKTRSFSMNTFLKNSFIRYFDVRGVKMCQGQNVSFSFSNDGVQREGCNTLQYLQRNGGTGFGVGQGVVVAR